MSLLGNVERKVNLVRSVAQDMRQLWFTVSAAAVAQSNAGLGNVAQVSRVLGPRLRQLVDDQVEELQRRMDKLNCSLAEKAVPADRREGVRRLTDARHDNGARRSMRLVGDPGAVRASGKDERAAIPSQAAEATKEAAGAEAARPASSGTKARPNARAPARGKTSTGPGVTPGKPQAKAPTKAAHASKPRTATPAQPAASRSPSSARKKKSSAAE